MDNYLYHPDGKKPPIDDQWIFVFGSNLSGIHGAGAAKEAHDTYDAMWGYGVGRQGRSFAIPTKDKMIETMSLKDIESYIQDVFLPYAKKQSQKLFWITRVGCGLAGYSDSQIAPMFKGATMNCVFPEQWKGYLE